MEENNIKEIFQKNMKMPDQVWQDEVLGKLKSVQTKSNSIRKDSIEESRSNLIFNKLFMSRQRQMMFGLFAIVLLGGLGSLGFYLYRQNNKNENGLYSAAEQRDLLAKILEKNGTTLTLATNNSQNAYDTQSLKAGAAPENASDQRLANAQSLIASPFAPVTENKLIYTKTKYYFGPATCGPQGDNNVYNNGYISENYNYYDIGGNMAYKAVDSTLNGQLFNYYVSKTTGEQTETYEYKGGSYAIKRISKYSIMPLAAEDPTTTSDAANTSESFADGKEGSIPAAEPIPVEPDGGIGSTPDPILGQIDAYFGPDAKITKKETLNGKVYLVIESSYKTDCSGSIYEYKAPNYWEGENFDSNVSSNPANDSIVTAYWVDESSLELYKTETYKGSISPANLMSGNEIMASTSEDSDFVSASSKLAFDIQTEIKEVVEKEQTQTDLNVNNDKQVNDTDNYFRSENIKPIMPVSGTGLYFSGLYTAGLNPAATTSSFKSLSLVWGYGDGEYGKLRTARAFYPAGSLGDQLFEQEVNFYENIVTIRNDDYPQSLVSISYSDQPIGNNGIIASGFKSAYLDVYESSADDIKIINSKIYIPAISRNIENVTISLGGQSIAGRLYTYSYKNITAYDTVGNPIDCVDQSCVVASYFLIFDLNGYKYVFNESNMDSNYQSLSVSFNNDFGSRFELADFGTSVYQSLLTEYRKSLDNVISTLSEPAVAI